MSTPQKKASQQISRKTSIESSFLRKNSFNSKLCAPLKSSLFKDSLPISEEPPVD